MIMRAVSFSTKGKFYRFFKCDDLKADGLKTKLDAAAMEFMVNAN